MPATAKSRKEPRTQKLLVPLVVAVALVAFLLGGELNPTMIVEEPAAPLILSPEGSQAAIAVPAVNEAGTGLVTTVEVSVEPGQGRTLTNIDTIFSLADTQDSILKAREVAEDVTGFDLSAHDLIYTITADASVIEGPSAGAAITVATIAAIQEQQPNPTVMITGTILPDGRIGKVGQVKEKALAARDHGATIFLIPRGSGLSEDTYVYERVRTCSIIDSVEVCETSYEKHQKSGLGIEIREVGTIHDALPYFFGEGA
ncbi:MAG: hypothetical protein HY369_02650 [Candidatus Aenigmarchaeota archaeon]|nr:hypothetical protein [Candidatus Aenigmarchaeota archaeon]